MYNYWLDKKTNVVLKNDISRTYYSEHPNDFTEVTIKEYDAYILKTNTLPKLAQDNLYQSSHKNAETFMAKAILLQIEELKYLVEVKTNSGDAKTADVFSTQANEKIKKLIAYQKSLITISVERQSVMFDDVVNGSSIDDAYNHSLNIVIKDTDALDGKNLHIEYLKNLIGITEYEKYIADTSDVEYSTHLSEDEGELNE